VEVIVALEIREVILILDFREAILVLGFREVILVLEFREARAQSSLNLLDCQQDQAAVAVVAAVALVLDHAIQVQVPAFTRDQARSSI